MEGCNPDSPEREKKIQRVEKKYSDGDGENLEPPTKGAGRRRTDHTHGVHEQAAIEGGV